MKFHPDLEPTSAIVEELYKRLRALEWDLYHQASVASDAGQLGLEDDLVVVAAGLPFPLLDVLRERHPLHSFAAKAEPADSERSANIINLNSTRKVNRNG